ncbi:MAG: ribulose-phosphate 3-epimerase [Bdellovibrionales bacterium]|nr:ribulose-phosphate 3-epimerase [Bdellovibrionales bacterium]
MSSVVAPSLLASDWGRFRDECKAAEDAGADWLHMDVMDGHFVPPITFGPDVIAVAKKAVNIPIDVHLMIESPERQLQAFADAGADSISVHTEACPNLHRTLQEIKRLGCKAGAAINPGTPVTAVEAVLDLCDIVLVMTVNPGWGGQTFIDSTLGKVTEISKEIARRSAGALIEVDGGINAETGKRARDAGASIFVAGTYVFGSTDYAAAIKSLK